MKTHPLNKIKGEKLKMEKMWEQWMVTSKCVNLHHRIVSSIISFLVYHFHCMCFCILSDFCLINSILLLFSHYLYPHFWLLWLILIKNISFWFKLFNSLTLIIFLMNLLILTKRTCQIEKQTVRRCLHYIKPYIVLKVSLNPTKLINPLY